jgi:hypothetical protein
MTVENEKPQDMPTTKGMKALLVSKLSMGYFEFPRFEQNELHACLPHAYSMSLKKVAIYVVKCYIPNAADFAATI